MTAQAAAALRRANRCRSERAAWRAAIKEGTTTLAALLAERPACLGSMPVWRLLMLFPGFGQSQLRALNTRAMRADFNLVLTLDELTERRVEWLLGEARAFACFGVST